MPALDELLARFPRLGLAHLPTPLEPLARLSAHLGGPTIWVKRDDATGLGLGGNKLRKLDYVLHEAVRQGADTLVSGGVVQSNSQRLVAAAAAKLGLECHLAVYHGRVAAPSEDYRRSGNALLNRLFGAQQHDIPWNGDRSAAIETLADDLRAKGRRVFTVPYGVSNALGAVGYASVAAEIAEQSAAMGFCPEAIVHCSGSGGTQAGLLLGASIALPGTRVIGVDIDAEPERVEERVRVCAASAAALFGATIGGDAIEIVAGHAGPAYGVPHRATIDAIKLMGQLEGLVLDPVYTGKGLAGLIAMIRAGRWRPDEHVIFVHTGGVPALFAYADSLGI